MYLWSSSSDEIVSIGEGQVSRVHQVDNGDERCTAEASAAVNQYAIRAILAASLIDELKDERKVSFAFALGHAILDVKQPVGEFRRMMTFASQVDDVGDLQRVKTVEMLRCLTAAKIEKIFNQFRVFERLDR